jgi:hypothetical protein
MQYPLLIFFSNYLCLQSLLVSGDNPLFDFLFHNILMNLNLFNFILILYLPHKTHTFVLPSIQPSCLSICFIIAYLGVFTPDFRLKIVKSWQEELVVLGIPHTPGCTLRSTLSDPVAIRCVCVCVCACVCVCIYSCVRFCIHSCMPSCQSNDIVSNGYSCDLIARSCTTHPI